MNENGQKDPFGGVIMTIVGVFILLGGLYFKDKIIVRDFGWTSLEPLGYLFIAIGLAFMIFGIYSWTSNV